MEVLFYIQRVSVLLFSERKRTTSKDYVNSYFFDELS